MMYENKLRRRGLVSEFKYSPSQSQTVIMTVKSTVLLGDVRPHRMLGTGFYL